MIWYIVVNEDEKYDMLQIIDRPVSLMLRLHQKIQSADRIFVFLSADKQQFVGGLKLLH